MPEYTLAVLYHLPPLVLASCMAMSEVKFQCRLQYSEPLPDAMEDKSFFGEWRRDSSCLDGRVLTAIIVSPQPIQHHPPLPKLIGNHRQYYEF